MWQNKQKNKGWNIMKPKVLVVASVYIHIKHFHLPYIKEFKQRGWEVDLACNGCAGQAAEADNYIDVPFEKSFLSFSNFRACKLLRKQIMQRDYDLVICHTSLAAFFTRLAMFSMKKRPAVCNMVHGYLFDDSTSLFKKAILVAAEKITAPLTDLIITMNNYDTEFAKAHKLAKRVVCVDGIGLDPSKFSESIGKDKAELRNKLGINEAAYVFLYAAEFSKRKNQKVFIEAMPLLPENAILALPGNGELFDDCKVLANRLGLGDRVLFPGYVTNMSDWFNAVDAVVSSSRSEGLPFNIMEAMYHGLPIIASKVKGHTDLIEDGVNGFLYPCGDREEFAKKANRIINEPELRKYFGERSKKLVKKNYLENVLPTVMELYESSLKA